MANFSLSAASHEDRFKAAIKILMKDRSKNEDKINQLLIAMTLIDDRKALRSMTYRNALEITHKTLGD
jgi:hypothetical protein